MKLGIIGTAGRGPDGAKLTAAYWRSMYTVAQVVVTVSGADSLVSGGSAWADHLAVALYLDGHVKRLTLHLPCAFHEIPGTWCFQREHECGSRLNELHARFQQVTGSNPFDQIAGALRKGARIEYHRRSFKARNTDVAHDADCLLAFTFGDGPRLAEGGTQDTWDKWMTRREQAQSTAWMNGASFVRPAAYHFDLTTRRLYTL